MKGKAARHNEIHEEQHCQCLRRRHDQAQRCRKNSTQFVAATAFRVFPKAFSDGQIGALFIS